MRERKKKRIIIISLLGLLCIMTVGYAAFQSNLKIKGTSSISSNWNILITNVEEINQGGEGENAKAPTWTSLTANVEANLYSKGDYVEYLITIENKGTVDAVLSNITPTEKEYKDKAIKITYSGVNINDKLYKEEKAELKVKIEYNPEYGGVVEESSSELEIILEYTQAEIAGEPVLNSNLYVSNSGDDETGIGTTTKPYKTIEKAYSEASDNSTIYIMDDITQTETLNLNENKNITITSHGVNHSIIRGNSLTSYVIDAEAGTVNLENITIDGNNVEAQAAMIRVKSIANIDNNTLITKANNVNDFGGAIIVDGGTLTMNDGEISYNKCYSADGSGRGGGIYIAVNSKLTLNNGRILNNISYYGGGIMNSGFLTIENAKIYKNSAYLGGGIKGDSNSKIIVNGGEIYENESEGSGGGIEAYANTGTESSLNINGGIIRNNKSHNGGGVFVSTNTDGNFTFSFNGGVISNNNASNKGGGIYIAGSNSNANRYPILTVSNNALIDGNEAINGGGIFTGLYSKLIIQGGTISNNRVSMTTGGGGGIHVSHNSAFTMTGGEIIKNSGWHGYAVMIANNSSFIMSGGSIANNTGVSGAVATWNDYIGNVCQITLDGGIIKNNSSTGQEYGGLGIWQGKGKSTYTYKSGIVCGNTPSSSYETHTTCPS